MRHLDQHLNLKTIFCSDIMLHSMPYNKVQVASWSRGTDFMPNLTFFISSIKSKMYAALKNRSRRMSWPRTLSYICISLHTHWCTFYTVSQKRIPNICSCNSSMCSWILITLGRNILYKHTQTHRHTDTQTHTHTHLGLHRRYDGSLLVIDESVHVCRVQFWSCRSGSNCCTARHQGCWVVVRRTSGLLVYARELRYACPQT